MTFHDSQGQPMLSYHAKNGNNDSQFGSKYKVDEPETAVLKDITVDDGSPTNNGMGPGGFQLKGSNFNIASSGTLMQNIDG